MFARFALPFVILGLVPLTSVSIVPAAVRGATILSPSAATRGLGHATFAKKGDGQKGSKKGNNQNGGQKGSKKGNNQNGGNKGKQQPKKSQSQSSAYKGQRAAAPQKVSAKTLADRALAAAVNEHRAAKQEAEKRISELDRVKRKIEAEQPASSPLKRAKSEYETAHKEYREFLASPPSSTVNPETAKLLAKARVTVAEEKYRKLLDETYKNDDRYYLATSPLRAALHRKGDAAKVLERRRIESLVLVGRIPGLYQPPPHDPATAQAAMRVLAARTKAALEAFKRGSREPWKDVAQQEAVAIAYRANAWKWQQGRGGQYAMNKYRRGPNQRYGPNRPNNGPNRPYNGQYRR